MGTKEKPSRNTSVIKQRPSASSASLVVQLVKNRPEMWESWFDPWVGKIPWRRE